MAGATVALSAVIVFCPGAVAGEEGAVVPSPAHGIAPPPNHWVIWTLNAASVVCFVLWWRWMDRRSSGPVLSVVTGDPGTDGGDWKARALAAEARADKATALLRARLMPQMARWMMSELVQRLVSHRSGLLSSQQQAEREVAELERRLEQLQAPLAERLRAYEQRIADLERELAAKGEENRELLKARIASARQKLELERAKHPPEWN